MGRRCRCTRRVAASRGSARRRGCARHRTRTSRSGWPVSACRWCHSAGRRCFAVGEVNQQALFGRLAAVVHHGGAGTTTTATRAGAPQVVVLQVVNQPYWAGRVADLGIGTAHDGPTPTTESLSAALKTTLTPETRARATAVAGRYAPTGDGGRDAAARRSQPRKPPVRCSQQDQLGSAWRGTRGI